MLCILQIKLEFNKKGTMKIPLVRLPRKTQRALYLIREELKSRKLFNALHEVGLDDCYFQPHLDSLILQSVGLDDGKDETFNTYRRIMDKRSRKITGDYNSITKQALKVYQELAEQRKMVNSKGAL